MFEVKGQNMEVTGQICFPNIFLYHFFGNFFL